MSEESTRSLIATFRHVFPHTIAFKDRDLILLGSRHPIRLSMDRLAELYRNKEVAESLARAGMKYPSDVLVSMSLDAKGAELFSTGAPINTDDDMRLELRAPRSLYTDHVEEILEAMRRHPPDVVTALTDVASESSVRIELAASYFTSGHLDAALRNAQRAVEVDDSFEGQKLLGQILQRLGRKDEARVALERALHAGGDPAGRHFVEAMLRSLDGPAGS